MRPYQLVPKLSLQHLKTLTDNNGIIQHAKYCEPELMHGYCADDNARALIVTSMAMALYPNADVLDLLRTYLQFLEFVQKDDGSFHNFVDKDMGFLDVIGSEDSYGRCLWAAGYLSSFPYLSPILTKRGRDVFLKAVHHAEGLDAPRAKSFAVSGIAYYLRGNPSDLEALMMLERLAIQLVGHYEYTSSDEWHWFEDSLTYCNGRLVQALFVAYQVTGRWKFLEVAEKTLGFLGSIMLRDDKLFVVGNKGWYLRDREVPLYDQQPVDAATMVELYTQAYLATGRYAYYRAAIVAFDWFMGTNSQGLAVYDPLSGGCFDALTEEGVNLNRGAESTVCYLIARMLIEFLNQPTNSRKELLLYL